MQTMIVESPYTKAQEEVLRKLKALIGKVFNESSLTTELNKISDRNNWCVFNIANGLLITMTALGMSIYIRLNRHNGMRTQFKLNEISYL